MGEALAVRVGSGAGGGGGGGVLLDPKPNREKNPDDAPLPLAFAATDAVSVRVAPSSASSLSTAPAELDLLAAAISASPCLSRPANRSFTNSPWSHGWVHPEPPEDGRWVAQATFHEPGTYLLRGLVDDGGLSVYYDVTVEVTSLIP